MRALYHPPGGIGRFIPGRIGANHSRLRHIGWQKCCHGLTCRPLETFGEGVLSEPLGLLGYPAGSGTALLGGTLRLKSQTLPFARRKPTWKIPLLGRRRGGNILAAGGNNTIRAEMITVLTRYRPIVFELICRRNDCNFPRQ